jgi:hypothetical protein
MAREDFGPQKRLTFDPIGLEATRYEVAQCWRFCAIIPAVRLQTGEEVADCLKR